MLKQNLFSQVSNRKVPKEILLSLSHLTRFLSERSDDKNEEKKEMRDVDTLSRFTEERRKSLIILKSPFTTTTTPSPPPDDLFSKDDFEYEDEGLDYYQYDQFEKADDRFRFSFKQQQVTPPIKSESGSARFEPKTTTKTTTTRRPETTTAVFLDTPFRLKLDPISGLFKTVKDFR